MHELSVVFKVIDIVEKVASENEATNISSVTLQIGEVSGIVHSYLYDCWKWAIKKSDLLQEAELIIETIPAKTYCEDCGGTYETVKYAKICPYCQSEHTYLIQGNEFEIKEIAV